MNVEVLKRIAKSHSSKLLALASVTSFALTLYSAWESFPRTRCDIDEADYISKKYSGQPISNGRKTLIFLKSNKKTITLAFATAVLMLLEYRTMEKQISTLKASYFLLNEQLKAGHQFPILNKDPSEEKSYITENFNPGNF